MPFLKKLGKKVDAVENHVRIVFFLGFVALSFCTFMIPWWYIPPNKGVYEYSFLMNGNCGGVAGLTSLETVSNATRKCVEVYVLNDSDDDFRSFMEAYVGTLLFFCYTIHQISSSYFEHPERRIVGQWMFCIGIIGEACFLIWSCYQKFQVRAEVEASLVSDPYSIMSYDNMYYNLEHTLFWQSMIGRSLCWIILFGAFICDVYGFGYFTCCARKNVFFITNLFYEFCFLLVMTSCGLFILYMALNVNLSALDFSYIAKTNCPLVEGFSSNAAVTALGGTSAACVYEVAWNYEYSKLSSFFSVYVTTLIFYALTLVEGLDFIGEVDSATKEDTSGKKDQMWLARGRLMLVFILILEAGTFLSACIRLWFERKTTTWSLENSNPSGERCNWLVYSILMIRGASMVTFFSLVGMARFDAREAVAVKFKDAVRKSTRDFQLAKQLANSSKRAKGGSARIHPEPQGGVEA